MKRILITGILGIILGFLATKVLTLQVLTVIPWGLAALIIGYLSNNRKESIKNGLAYGFFLGFVFMVANYNGADPVATKIPFFVLMGVVSAVFGAVLSIIGNLIPSRSRKKTK
ncbi:MAG TPA: hypothetical protein VHE53_00765 [Patescibacteria group bacterium]|nr:hypothetical protein [Patescibacteria group bacterium]